MLDYKASGHNICHKRKMDPTVQKIVLFCTAPWNTRVNTCVSKFCFANPEHCVFASFLLLLMFFLSPKILCLTYFNCLFYGGAFVPNYDVWSLFIMANFVKYLFSELTRGKTSFERRFGNCCSKVYILLCLW